MSDASDTYRWAFQQDQSREICGHVDQPLTTPELHPQNDYYGQAHVLKTYAGIKTSRSLKFVVEHGIHLDDIVWEIDTRSPLSAMASCSEWRGEVLRRESNKSVMPTGFGYLYAMDVTQTIAGPDPCESARLGTLAFPCHSTHSITATFDHRSYAERLKSLPEEYQPVYLCGYWKDILDGRLQPYEEQGLPVVTCGHMYDPNFMLRFHDLCRQFRYTVSNSLGTHLFQSVASGCRFFFLDSTPVEYDIPERDRPQCGQFNPMFQAVEKQARALFSSPSSIVTQAQQDFVDRYIGTKYKLSREDLRRWILKCEWLDRTIPRTTCLSDGTRIYAPPAIARTAAKPLQKLRKWKRSIVKRLPGVHRAA